MAMITPASEDFPSMIPPEDFPPDDEFGGLFQENRQKRGASLVCIEPRELNVLTGFLAAFSRYLANRHDPEASSGVMVRYRAALRFYDGCADLAPDRPAERETGRPAAKRAKPSGTRQAAGSRKRPSPAVRPAEDRTEKRPGPASRARRKRRS